MLKLLVVWFQLSMGLSEDCPNVIQLALGLQMDVVQPLLMSQLQTDCCNATGITCFEQNVIIVVWSGYRLNGTINATAIPVTLVNFDLQRNLITGKVPSFQNGIRNIFLSDNLLNGTIPAITSSILYLDLSRNQLTGSIPELPNNLSNLYLFGNQLTGIIPPLPSTLNNLRLGHPSYLGNHLQGTIYLIQPVRLMINGNWITNVIVNDTSQLSQCDLSQNPLLGIPSLDSLPMCLQNGLYSANTLPLYFYPWKTQSRLCLPCFYLKLLQKTPLVKILHLI